jgi:cell division topological specificity factor
MSLFNLFRRQNSNLFRRKNSAPVARERLQILLSYERSARGQSDLLGVLREEILVALGKHITVDRDNLVMRMDRGATRSTLEIEVVIPHSGGTLVPALAQGNVQAAAGI